MLGRSRTKEKAKSNKQTRNETRTDKRRNKKDCRKDAQKGRGKRARETIREQPQPSKKTKQQPMSRNAGPPLKIGGGSERKQVTGTTPEEVVRNIRRQRR